jgi:hypothetical protein
MTDAPPEISILDARLAEIDRRLSSIQTGLADDISVRRGVPAAGHAAPPAGLPPRVEVAEPSPAAAPTAGSLLDQLRSLADAHERVLRSTRELLSAYERVLTRLPADPVAAKPQEFSVSAGPFASTEALRRFERTLAEIHEVREVSVRGFEGEDRAIVDVHLFEPNT